MNDPSANESLPSEGESLGKNQQGLIEDEDPQDDPSVRQQLPSQIRIQQPMAVGVAHQAQVTFSLTPATSIGGIID